MISLRAFFSHSRAFPGILQISPGILGHSLVGPILTTGKFSTDKNCTPGSKIITFKNILSPCITKAFKCLIFWTTSLGGIFRAVGSTDKLIKAHCFL